MNRKRIAWVLGAWELRKWGYRQLFGLGVTKCPVLPKIFPVWPVALDELLTAPSFLLKCVLFWVIHFASPCVKGKGRVTKHDVAKVIILSFLVQESGITKPWTNPHLKADSPEYCFHFSHLLAMGTWASLLKLSMANRTHTSGWSANVYKVLMCSAQHTWEFLLFAPYDLFFNPCCNGLAWFPSLCFLSPHPHLLMQLKDLMKMKVFVSPSLIKHTVCVTASFSRIVGNIGFCPLILSGQIYWCPTHSRQHISTATNWVLIVSHARSAERYHRSTRCDPFRRWLLLTECLRWTVLGSQPLPASNLYIMQGTIVIAHFYKRGKLKPKDSEHTAQNRTAQK